MSQVIKFDYLPVPYADPVSKTVIAVYRPLIPIRLSMNHRISKYTTQVLLDSGADRNLFPAEMAEILGVKIQNKKLIYHEGIGKTVVKAYEHKVSIYLQSIKIDTTADFSADHEIPLLGRTGFFAYFDHISFYEQGIDGYVALVTKEK